MIILLYDKSYILTNLYQYNEKPDSSMEPLLYFIENKYKYKKFCWRLRNLGWHLGSTVGGLEAGMFKSWQRQHIIRQAKYNNFSDANILNYLKKDFAA